MKVRVFIHEIYGSKEPVIREFDGVCYISVVGNSLRFAFADAPDVDIPLSFSPTVFFE